MNMQEIKDQDTRRTIVSLLAYDTDYTLSETLIMSACDQLGKDVTHDQLTNQVTWLAENSFVTVNKNMGVSVVTLTDRGLEIATGKSRAVGIRNLRPSEIAEIKAR